MKARILYLLIIFNTFLINALAQKSKGCDGFWKLAKDSLSVENLGREPNYIYVIRQLNAYKACNPDESKKADEKIIEVNKKILQLRDKAVLEKKRADSATLKAVKEAKRATSLYWASISDSLLPAHQIRLLFRADSLDPKNKAIQEKITNVFNSPTSNLFSEKLSFETFIGLRNNGFKFSKNDKYLLIDGKSSRNLYSLPKFQDISKENGFNENFYFSINRDFLLSFKNKDNVEFFSLENFEKIKFDTSKFRMKDNHYEIVGNNDYLLIKEVDFSKNGINRVEKYFFYKKNNKVFYLMKYFYLKSHYYDENIEFNSNILHSIKNSVGSDSVYFNNLLAQIELSYTLSESLNEDRFEMKENSQIFNNIRVNINTIGSNIYLNIFNNYTNVKIKTIQLSNTENLFFQRCEVSSSERYIVCIFMKIKGISYSEDICKIFDLEQPILSKFHTLKQDEYIAQISETGEFFFDYDGSRIWKNMNDSLQLIYNDHGILSTFRYPYKTYSNCCKNYVHQNQLMDLSTSNYFSFLNQSDSIRNIKISEFSNYISINHLNQFKSILYDFKGNVLMSSDSNDIYYQYFNNGGDYFFSKIEGYFQVWNINKKNINKISFEKLTRINVNISYPINITANDSLITLESNIEYRYNSILSKKFELLYDFKNDSILIENARQIYIKNKNVYFIDSVGCFKIFNLTKRSYTQPILNNNFWGFELIGNDKILLKIFNGINTNGINIYIIKLFILSNDLISEINLSNSSSKIFKIRFSNDYNFIASFHSDGFARIWKLEGNIYKQTYKKIYNAYDAFFSIKNEYVVVTEKCKIHLFNFNTNKENNIYTNINNDIRFNPINILFDNSLTIYITFSNLLFKIKNIKFLEKPILLDDFMALQRNDYEKVDYAYVKDWFKKFEYLLTPFTKELENKYSFKL